MKELLALPANKVMIAMGKGEVDPRQLFELQIAYARKVEPMIHSFLHLSNGAQEELEQDFCPDNPRLSGVPISVKDIIATVDFPTTAGSRILEGYVPPYDATVVKLLKQAGNPITGKTNLDEFAMGSSTENSGYFPTLNPWDTSRVPGGSSGGGATSVCALQSFIGLGTDTGGSVRQPASFCGVYGYRPTYGFVSRLGLIAYASSLDQVGIFARDVKDIAYTMNTISKPDPLDATCVAQGNIDFVQELTKSSGFLGKKIGVIASLMDEKLIDEEVLQLCEESLKCLAGAGVEVVSVELPYADYLLPCYYILTSAEASSNLARYDGIRYGKGVEEAPKRGLREHYFTVRTNGFGSEVKRRILLGTYVLSAGYAERYYNQARMLRRIVVDAVDELLEEVDILFAPTSPTPAFRLGEKVDDPVKMWASDVCVVLANLANLPSISVPAWLTSSGLPLGIQFMGRRGEDASLLAFARLYEEITDLQFRIPPLIKQALKEFNF